MTYNIRTLLRDGNIQELEEELRLTRLNKLKIVQKAINSFYKDVGNPFGKPNQYTILIGNINAQLWRKKPNLLETATDQIELEMRNERVDWVTLRKYKIMNMMYQKIAGMRWTWKS